MLQTSREWVLGQPLTHPVDFAVVFLAAVLALVCGWVLYRLSMPILIERMGG